MEELRFAVALLTALGCGLVSGIFFAFSFAVMRGLAKIPAASGIAAMQTVNVVIVNPVFLFAFVGTAVLSVAAVILALASWSGVSSVFIVIGAVLYLVGGVVVTGSANVPRNNALDRVDPASDEGARYWSGYLSQWTAWNHVRMVASLLASAAFVLAIHQY